MTLAISTLLYVAVVWISLVTIEERELATSDAPLALVFERLTGASPKTMSLIAVMATPNGIIECRSSWHRACSTVWRSSGN
jgi:basic amino acid/polyamine antiporter, APA family